MSCSKTAELIEMPFGVCMWGPRNHALSGCSEESALLAAVLRLNQFFILHRTVKPSNLAAPKVGEFTGKFILAPFILANPNYIVPTLE